MSTRETLLPAYLIYGSDRPKVELAVRRLRSRVEEAGGGVEALSAGGDEAVAPPDVVDSCNALGLFGGQRLVLVTAVEAWKDKASPLRSRRSPSTSQRPRPRPSWRWSATS